MENANTKKIPKTIQELIRWKNNDDEFISESVEEHNKEYTDLCGGNLCTDTLFSFISLYAIGIYIFNRQKRADLFSVNNRILFINDKPNGKKYRQVLASQMFINNLINSNQHTLLDLNELNTVFNKFVNVYFKSGNVIPMWPGGNMMKGNQNLGYYDITSIFFHRFPKYYDMLKNSIIPTFFDDYSKEYIMEQRFEDLNSLLNSMPTTKDYENYLKECITIINKRTDAINEYLLNIRD